MRRPTAREILADSFRELAAHSSIDKITIRAITDNCGYSPATFYRQFKDKYDLIAWDYTREVGRIMDRVGVDGYPWRQTLLEGARYLWAQRDYLANLLTHTSGLDSFIDHMTQANCAHLRACVCAAAGTDSLEPLIERSIRIYCLGTVHLFSEWILGGFSATPEEMATVFEQALPDSLRPYLCQI
ncbi:MAG: TetR family transcriptional regulator [Oscillospiraceae bacterium]|nr:TetR family transcriptional regulator [Oscillospiraceae bacterium]